MHPARRAPARTRVVNFPAPPQEGQDSGFAPSAGGAGVEPQREQPFADASVHSKHHGHRTGWSRAAQYAQTPAFGSAGAPQAGQR